MEGLEYNPKNKLFVYAQFWTVVPRDCKLTNERRYNPCLTFLFRDH